MRFTPSPVLQKLTGIFLAELAPVTCECHSLSGAPWPLACFRAIDERATDVSELTMILTEEHDDEALSL